MLPSADSAGSDSFGFRVWIPPVASLPRTQLSSAGPGLQGWCPGALGPLGQVGCQRLCRPTVAVRGLGVGPAPGTPGTQG